MNRREFLYTTSAFTLGTLLNIANTSTKEIPHTPKYPQGIRISYRIKAKVGWFTIPTRAELIFSHHNNKFELYAKAKRVNPKVTIQGSIQEITTPYLKTRTMNINKRHEPDTQLTINNTGSSYVSEDFIMTSPDSHNDAFVTLINSNTKLQDEQFLNITDKLAVSTLRHKKKDGKHIFRADTTSIGPFSNVIEVEESLSYHNFKFASKLRIDSYTTEKRIFSDMRASMTGYEIFSNKK